MTKNRLADETSPYLLQHKDNPVHWMAWGDEAFELAKRENRPILLSVGYAACHWCHVMAHESFEDQEIADQMNANFVNIKVDREERPDVDSIYQSALQMMGEQGGWPLTMFLTPDRGPYWGGTYFPSTPRYGRPGFPQILDSVANAYHQQRDQVDANVSAMTDALANLGKPNGGGSLTIKRLDDTAGRLLQYIDPVHGGTIGAPKFPQPALFRFLWHAFKRSGAPQFRDPVVRTLDHICQGGIYDHLGGGFSRYSTDEVWLAPHFEKMLYDNALLIELIADVWLETGSTLYRQRVEESIDWLLREMRAETANANDGFAFTSALDADSEGVEGKFYVWSEEEIDSLLGKEAGRFKTAYNVTRYGNWEHATILNRTINPEFGDAAAEAALAANRATLLEARTGRIRPQRDDKVLADWNGLMISALVKAAAVFDRPEWLEVARTAFRFIVTQLAVAGSDNGRLHHGWCAGRASHPAVVDDYANLSRAALVLHEATDDPAYLAQAREWVTLIDTHYWDTEDHGYFLNADDTTDTIARPKPIHDNAVPPGNGVMVEVLARLFFITGDDAYRVRAEQLITACTPPEEQGGGEQLTLFTGFEFLQTAAQIVIVGEPLTERSKVGSLTRRAIEAGLGCRLLLHVNGDDGLPTDHPAHGKAALNGLPTAYVCVGQTCGLPVTDADALAKSLVAM